MNNNTVLEFIVSDESKNGGHDPNSPGTSKQQGWRDVEFLFCGHCISISTAYTIDGNCIDDKNYTVWSSAGKKSPNQHGAVAWCETFARDRLRNCDRSSKPYAHVHPCECTLTRLSSTLLEMDRQLIVGNDARNRKHNVHWNTMNNAW